MNTAKLLKEADALISSKKNPNRTSTLPFINSYHNLQKSIRSSQFEIMETSISLDEMFTCLNKDEFISDLWAGVCEPDYSIKNTFFIQQLAQYIFEKKFIFVFLGLEEYILGEDEKTSYNKEAISHATSLLIYPSSYNTYDMYLFNPHGNYSKDVFNYEKYVTRYRKKQYKLQLPLDVYIIQKIKTELQKELLLHNPQNLCKIQYENNYKYNYWGPNLQIADVFGLCFTYPVILFTYICNNNNPFNEIHISKDTTRKFPGTSKLIKQGRWELLIYFCLLESVNTYSSCVRNNPSLKKTINNLIYSSYLKTEQQKYTEFIDDFEEFLEKYSHLLAKSLLYTFNTSFTLSISVND